MPRVPEYGGFQTTPGIAPGQTIQGIDPNVSAEGRRQTQDAFNGIHQAQQTASNIALDFAQEANKLRVKDALNKLMAEQQRLTYDKTEGYQTILGGNALERGDKGSLMDEYGTKLSGFGDKLRAALGNDAQRRMFDEGSMGVYREFDSGIQKHVLKQFYTYGDSVRQQEAERIAQGMMLTDDPEVIANGVMGLQRIAQEHSQIYGTEADVTKLTGPILQRVIDAKISGGYLGTAKRMMEAFSPYLGADNIAALKKAYQEESEYAQADAAAKKAHELSKTKGMEAAAAYLEKQPYNIKQNANAFFNGMIARDKQIQEEVDRNTKITAYQSITEGKWVTPSHLSGASPEVQKDVLEFQLKYASGHFTVTNDEVFVGLMQRINSGTAGIQDALLVRDQINDSDWEQVKDACIKAQAIGADGLSARGRLKDQVMKSMIYFSGQSEKKLGGKKLRQMYDAASIAIDDKFTLNQTNIDTKDLGRQLMRPSSSGWFGTRYWYQDVGAGKRGEFNLGGGDLATVKETMTIELPQWKGKEVDDLTARAYVSLNQEDGMYRRDFTVNTVVRQVRASMQNKNDDKYGKDVLLVRYEEAEQEVLDGIKAGKSLRQIVGEANAQPMSPERLRQLQELAEFKGF